MTATTGQDILTLALKDCGRFGTGQTPLGEDLKSAQMRMNWMLAQWNRKRWLIFHDVTVGVVSTGQLFYTIGPGGDIDVSNRPDKLEAAFFRQLVQSQPNQVDYPVELITSMEDYSRISLKQLQTFPMYAFLDSSWPLGKLYFWPVPQASIYSVYVVIKDVLQNITDLAAEIELPDEYFAAIYYNMVVRLRAAYRLPEDRQLVGLAKDALNVVRGGAAQIARLQIPEDLCRPGIYNPYSDQTR